MDKVFAVRDSALGAFMSPFNAPSSGLAIRSFSDEVCRADCPMNTHPEDYELFELGEFDTDTGRFSSYESPRSLVRAKDVKIPVSSETLLRAVK